MDNHRDVLYGLGLVRAALRRIWDSITPYAGSTFVLHDHCTLKKNSLPPASVVCTPLTILAVSAVQDGNNELTIHD